VSRQSIQGLWVGRQLSTMEQLSIASFLYHGHDYHLFTYERVEGLPDGAVREDARSILPESMIFQYQEFPSYAGFSNFFRYKLLLDRGGWWADTDLVCLRPFDWDEPYIFASEPTRDGREVPSSCALKAPVGDESMAYAFDTCRSRDPKVLRWGETGPRLVGHVIDRLGLERHRQPARTFCPIAYYNWRRLIDPADSCHFEDSTRAVHLWHEMWRREGADKDRDYPPGCLYERLKEMYLDPRPPRHEA
jgi:mannosyltransferase OCH1-like enzyme